MAEKKVVWLALNAKYTHTSLAVRYLREACADFADTELLELTINNHLLDILGQVYEAKPDVLGIACYIWNISCVRELLPLLRRVLPKLIILCGGPEVSYETTAFLREFPMVDYIIRGEGEHTVRKVLQKIFSDGPVEHIPGLAGRQGTAIFTERPVVVENLADLPFPYREAEMDALRERILYYETSRGCPFSCAYCLSCATRGVRYLPLDRVLSELAFFIRHDVRQVKFVDRTFNASKAHFLPILKYIAQQDCRTNFHFEVAIDYMDEEVLEVLSKMPPGRVQLEIGIQSTNPETLRKVSRNNHWERIVQHIQQILHFHNMHLHVDLILGLPEEDRESFARSFNAVYALQPDMLQLGFLKFLKGAAMMQQVAEGDYQYMDSAPYEVLSNRWLSYGEIRWFHTFESVFELYYNAGRCKQTIAYVIRTKLQGDAFSFYQAFSDYWEQHQYHRVAHKTPALYGYLLDFCQQAYGLSSALSDTLLRWDALLTDGGNIRPGVLHWNGPEVHAAVTQFWRQGPVKKYLPDYTFENWRKVRLQYHMESFPYRISFDTGEMIHEKTTVLFDYRQKGNVHWKIIEKEDFAEIVE